MRRRPQRHRRLVEPRSPRSPACPLPITGSILQAFVTEPVKPFLDKIIVSAQMHIYCSQTDRGEFLIGAEVEPYPTYSNKGTFPFIEYACRHMLELFPQLHATKILRHWTGLCDMSPDYSPIMGLTEVEGFLVDCGWGTYGFKAAPITGVTLAELIATGKTPAADRAVQARALLHRQPRLRARRRSGESLEPFARSRACPNRSPSWSRGL